MKRAIIFAHYDRDGLLDPHVDYMLQALRQHCDQLIFVSTHINQSEQARLTSLCDQVIARDNRGYDFCSWKLGIEYLIDRDELDEILFVNDSMYGPVNDLGRLFQEAENRIGDFWGAVRCRQQGDHIQSYFFAFRRPLIRIGLFDTFWQSVEALSSKIEIIQRYEVGLTKIIRDSGHQIFAIFDDCDQTRCQQLRSAWINGPQAGRNRLQTFLKLAKRRRPQNPTHRLWRTLLESGIPFVKVELLRDNPCGIDLPNVFSFLQTHTNYNISLIQNHLRRIRSIAIPENTSGHAIH